MLPALRSLHTHHHHPPLVLLPLSTSSGQKTQGIRFQRAVSLSTQPEENQDKMDKTHEQQTKDVMSDSFGEGYATRSEEEGFGGIHGGSQQMMKPKTNTEEKAVHGNHPAGYDKTQGSEVREKEKGRHQTHIA